MQYLGDFKYGATVYVPVATYGSNGESITLTGLAVTDIEVYRNGGTTQRASDNGYTLLDTDGIDFDGITGIHGFSIDTSDNTTTGFWQPGADYFVIVSTVTINSQTVTFGVHFSIENRGGDAVLQRTTIASLASQTSFTLTAGSADNDAYNDCMIVVHDQASTVQKCVGVIDDYTGSTRTVTLRTDPAVFTMATGDFVTILADRSLKPTVMNRTLNVNSSNEVVAASVSGTVGGNVTGSVGSVTGNVGGNVAGSVASVTGNVGGNVTGSVGSLAAQAKADVNAEVVDGLGVDTLVEMSAGAPPASPTMRQVLNYLYRLVVRNRKTVDASSSPAVETVFADDGTTPIFEREITDSSNVTTFGESAAP